MHPVIDLGVALPQAFQNLPKPEKMLLVPSVEEAARRKAWTNEWLEVMSR